MSERGNNDNLKVVVITGSTKGLGFEMARRFRRRNLNVVINGRDEKRVAEAVKRLEKIESEAGVLGVSGDMSVAADIRRLLCLSRKMRMRLILHPMTHLLH